VSGTGPSVEAMTTPDWEPPFSASPAEHLVAALDRQRATFRWKAEDLEAADLAVRIGASSLTQGGLLKHLTRVEDTTFTWKLAGGPPAEPWRSTDWEATPDWDFESAADDDPATLYSEYDAAVARSRDILAARLADGGLEQTVHWGKEHDIEVSLGRIVADLVEEYGRHTGQADLLREAVDGRVGEDPPQEWSTPW
jgi:hypothetical protein